MIGDYQRIQITECTVYRGRTLLVGEDFPGSHFGETIYETFSAMHDELKYKKGHFNCNSMAFFGPSQPYCMFHSNFATNSMLNYGFNS